MAEPLTKEQIAQILAKHLVWQRGEAGGERADLSRANLSGANLSRAYLSRANLNGANLNGANLNGAYLSRAYLSGAYLSRAYLSGAYLNGADLNGANLSRADLNGANLSRADLPFHVLQVGPIGSRADYLLYRFDTARVSTGCFAGTLDEFAAAVETTHGDNQHGQDYRAVIAMLRDMISRSAPAAEVKEVVVAEQEN